ncbi:NADH-quinone oxidoreductase subunit D [Candidatus Acetothermia bacterium]|nr:NADH-quinone oxidoreductase subunit D [Candidatus Acetothermia bacterium]MBI3461324.1 NADH-quinone oxidoreductase subunit D [Candidatus Acetothermia bacterium]
MPSSQPKTRPRRPQSPLQSPPPQTPPKTSPSRDTFILNLGPQHPSTHGVLRFILELDGETIVKCVPDVGFLHTGVEKQSEFRIFHQVFTLINRLDYLSGPQEEMGYSLAVEQLLGVEVPKRAQYLRVLLCELSRIASHLVWLGTGALEVNMSSVFMYCFDTREKILDIFEQLAGARFFPRYWRIGGLAWDVNEDWLQQVKNFLKIFPDRWKEYHDLVTENPIWLKRSKGIAKLTLQDCLDYSLTGPIIRGCGEPYDLRRVFPYSSYQDFEFDIPTQKEGDAYARYLVRMEEMRQSWRIASQALERLPEGQVKTEDTKITPGALPRPWGKNASVMVPDRRITAAPLREGIKIPDGASYHAIESSRGELGFYVVSDGSNKPYRVGLRTPSFMAIQALPKVIEGGLLADAVVAIASFDPVLGDVDR